MADVYNGDCNPNTPFAPYFNPDHLHPNVAGETAMANAISTQLFGLPDAPLNPPVLTATPTPGCAAAKVASAVLASAVPTTTTTVAPTTSVAPTTTTTPTSLLRSARSLAIWLLAELVVIAGVLALVARRRVAKRRRDRRRAMRVVSYPRVPPPSQPRNGPAPRPRNPRR